MDIKGLATAILTVLFCVSAYAQTEKQIVSIRADVQLINKSTAKYTKNTKSIFGLSTEGGEATYYTSGKGLKKIAAKLYGEMGNSTKEYFYRDEELIFVFEKINHYNRPLSGKVIRSEERRAYFASGECIRLIVGKKMIKPETIEFTEEVYAIVEIADQIKATYKE